MVSKKKKIIILTTMIALLLLTGYLNVVINNNLTTTASTTSSESFYVSFRNTRQEAREAEISLYDSIIESDSYSEEAKASAEESKMELIAQMEKEVVIEGLICSKGFSDAVFTQNDSYINVIVNADVLTAEQVTQIRKIIMDQTGYGIDNITIIPSAES